MTITTTNNKSQATGNGSVTVFNYNYIVLDATHMQVYLDGVLQASGYTVQDVGNPAGGTVTFTTAPALDVSVVLLRVVPQTQQVDYSPYDPFPAETHETALDKLTMITQQMQEELDRSWKVPVDTPPAVDVALPPYEAGALLGWSLTDQSQLSNYAGETNFQDWVDDAEAAAAAAAQSASEAQAYAGSAQGSSSSAANSANSAANSAAAAQVAKMEWKGVWNSTANYEANDVIQYLGSSFIALVGNINVIPVSGATWNLVAEAGVDGADGAPGEPGAPGAGTGDVVGPASSTDNYLPQFSGTSGKILKAGIPTSTFATPAQVALKADLTYVNSQDALKADKTYVDSQDALKANTTDVNAALALKADKTYVDSQDALKADKTYVDSQDALKAATGSAAYFINVKDKYTNKGSVTGTVTIDPTVDGGDVEFTMTGNTAVTFTTSGIAANESVICTVQVSGAFAVTWPAGIFWPTGGVPAYTSPSIYTFQMRNKAGTVQIFGFQSGAGMVAV